MKSSPMNRAILTVLGLLSLHGIAPADDDIPLLRPEERQAVEAQTEDFQRSIAPVLKQAANSTVRIWSGKRRLAYGTVIGDGKKILTKWSEITGARAGLVVEGPGGEALPAVIAGVYEDNDLAVLETSGTALTPVRWAKEIPPLGAFLAAPQPDGRLAAFGVVSVPPTARFSGWWARWISRVRACASNASSRIPAPPPPASDPARSSCGWATARSPACSNSKTPWSAALPARASPSACAPMPTKVMSRFC
jgi:hypothetical protein